jgi:hypothetical protein
VGDFFRVFHSEMVIDQKRSFWSGDHRAVDNCAVRISAVKNITIIFEEKQHAFVVK